jgi:hypothetical protein
MSNSQKAAKFTALAVSADDEGLSLELAGHDHVTYSCLYWRAWRCRQIAQGYARRG